MKRIYKYKLEAKRTTSIGHGIVVPKGAVYLNSANQHGDLVVWFEVHEFKEPEILTFMLLHTGDYLPSNKSKYLNTILFRNGDYVLHLYLLNR